MQRDFRERFTEARKNVLADIANQYGHVMYSVNRMLGRQMMDATLLEGSGYA